MSDGYGGHGYGSDDYGWDPHGGQQPQILGYDEYGRPVYQQDPPHLQDLRQQAGAQDYAGARDYGYAPQAYDGHDGYGTAYDPYAAQTGTQPPVTGPYGGDPYAAQQAAARQAADRQYDTGQYPAARPYAAEAYTEQPQAGPHTAQAPYGTAYDGYDPYGPAADTGAGLADGAGYGTGTIPAQAPPPDEPPGAAQGPRRDAGGDRGEGAYEDAYDTGEFSFVEEETDNSEDVIDWLKFSESRTERREEVKRRGRNRKRALVILLVLAVLGSVGYLWYAGKLPGIGAGPGTQTSAAGQQRDVLVVHLRTPDSAASSTALLVDNATTGQGTTLLLPNSLAVTTSDGATTTLGKSVEDEGATPTRDALNRLLGADIKGTWRLDTSFLEPLVDSVGGITLDTNATVPGEKKDDEPLVEKGEARELDGRAAVAYATHRGDAEPTAAQLKRFGQVMQAVLTSMSTDKAAATQTVESLGQILDPSLSQASLGASLASLAQRAQSDAYETVVLPVQDDGTLSASTSDGLVKEILGGTVQNSDPDAAPRVTLRNATGDEGADDAARVTLVNGGFTVVGARQADAAREESQVVYADEKQKERATAVAKTLGLPGDSVQKGDGANNADVTVILGGDYDG